MASLPDSLKGLDFSPLLARAQQEQLRRELLSSLAKFTKYFYEVRTGSEFIENWHHGLLFEHLEAVTSGQIKNLIINVSPGSSKTEITCINWPAWSLARNDMCRFLQLSYADRLVEINSQTCRDLILSDEYQELWERRLAEDSKGRKLWRIIDGQHKRGGMYAVATGGQVTGFRAGQMIPGFQGAIIMDDPQKPDDMESEAMRESSNRQIANTVRSRRAMPDTPLVLIMQRLHPADATQFLLDGGIGEEFTQVVIPALDETGKSYWELKEPTAKLESFRAAQPDVFQAQYMQAPKKQGGDEFKFEWIQRYHPINDYSGMNIYILVDPANDKKKRSDWTAMMVVGLAADNNYYVLDMVRDKLNPTERIDRVIQLHKKWNALSNKPPIVGYEKYGMQGDVHYLQKAQNELNYRFPIIELGGQMAKPDRIRRLIPLFQAKRVYLPLVLMYRNYANDTRDICQDFISHEYTIFPAPAPAHDDMLDALARICDPDLNALFPRIDPGLVIDINHPANPQDDDWMNW